MTQSAPWQPCAADGWHERPLKHAYSITLGKMLQNTPTGAEDVEVAYVKAQHVQWGSVNLTDLPTMWASPDEIDALRITAGDLLVCEGGDVGRAALVRHEPEIPTIIQNALHLVRGRHGCDPRFLLYVLRQAAESNWIRTICNASTLSHFTAGKFGEMRVWMPDIARQTAIADFLDEETARLDALAVAKERLLALLSEKRRAMVTRMVNRGLDPHAPMRNPGVSWLSQIPAHWEVWKIGHLAVVGNGSTPSRGNAAYWITGTIPWLNSSVVHQADIRQADQFVTSSAIRECHLPAVKCGDVLIAITGQGKTRGQAAVLAIDATISQHLAFIRPDHSKMQPWFLRWLLYTAYPFLRAISDDTGGTKGALTCEDIRNTRVPVPPPSEQAAILRKLAACTERIGLLADRVEGAISTLRERRAALISAAVTGQIAIADGNAYDAEIVEDR